MSMQVGLVGLPNVGKSTLFKALTKIPAEAANYPFCTIDPNIGIIPVFSDRLRRLNELVEPEKLVPSTLQVIDIAGLVKGASQGEGLGNQFLSHIRQVDAIAHVVRCFDDENIVHVHGQVDPLHDLEIIQTELILADLEQVERKLEKVRKQAKGNQEIAATISVFEKALQHLSEGMPTHRLDLSQEENLVLQELNLITRKPYLYIANVSEQGLEERSVQEQALQDKGEEEGIEVIRVCAQIEAELAEMEEEEAHLFLQELQIDQSSLEKLMHSCYQLLGQITYFTAGKKEVRAWNIPQGFFAPQAAGKIHTDFEKGFIRAETFHFQDIHELGSEQKVKEAGRWRLEGKEYVVQDGDIIHFRFHV